MLHIIHFFEHFNKRLSSKILISLCYKCCIELMY